MHIPKEPDPGRRISRGFFCALGGNCVAVIVRRGRGAVFMQRERLGSRLGFILLSAGCAIGVGNVWKFPWMVGQYGGGAFVAIYLFFLLVLGVPVLTM